MLVLVEGGLGVAGYALGVFISEVAATAHAHWLARRAWADPATAPVVRDAGGDQPVTDQPPEELLARRKLMADVSAAFVGLALLGLLQNIDVILLGRLDHANVGPYAAISVASKGLVFGALALGAYLLPEATIRWNEGGHAIRQLGVTLLFLAVPAAVLLGIAVVVPRQFLTLVFSARLATAASAFAPLVLAMMCLSFTVLVTNYLFGTGSRWIVLLLAAGSALAAVLVTVADGRPKATAWADLIVQALLALGHGHRLPRHPHPPPWPALVETVRMAAGGGPRLTGPGRRGPRSVAVGVRYTPGMQHPGGDSGGPEPVTPVHRGSNALPDEHGDASVTQLNAAPGAPPRGGRRGGRRRPSVGPGRGPLRTRSALRRNAARRDRRTVRAQAHRRGGLAGLRRPRGRRQRAARPPGDQPPGRRPAWTCP